MYVYIFIYLFIYTFLCTYIYLYIYSYDKNLIPKSFLISKIFTVLCKQQCTVFSTILTYEVITINFQTFFIWALLLIVDIWNSSPLRSNLPQSNTLVVPFQQLLEGPMEVLLCEHVNDLHHSLFHLLNCLITTDSELRE